MTRRAAWIKLEFKNLPSSGDHDRDLGGDEPGHLPGAGPQAAGRDHELSHRPVLAGNTRQDEVF